MPLKYLVVSAALIAVATPALAAEFYVVNDLTKKKCRIIETKPDGKNTLMIGTGPYPTRDEAKVAKDAAAECPKKAEKADKPAASDAPANKDAPANPDAPPAQ